MGSGASLPQKIDFETFEKHSGSRFGRELFEAYANGTGSIDRETFLSKNAMYTSLDQKLKSIKDSSKPELILNELNSIYSLCSVPENLIILSSPELELVPILSRFLCMSNIDVKLLCCQVLLCLASIHDNLTKMSDTTLAIIVRLLECTDADSGSLRSCSLELILKIELECMVSSYWRSIESKLFPIILKVIDEDNNSQERLLGCKILLNLVDDNEFLILMANPDYKLIVIFIKILRKYNDESALISCRILWTLSKHVRIRVTMCNNNTPEYNLISALLDVIRGDNGQLRIRCCGTLINLSSAVENMKYMCDKKLLEVLGTVIRDDEGNARIKAAGVLVNISDDNENAKFICEEGLQLLTILVSVMRRDTGQLRMFLCRIFWNLATHMSTTDTARVLFRSDLGLIDVLLVIIQQDTSQSLLQACGTLLSLSSSKKYISFFYDSHIIETDLLNKLIEMLQDRNEENTYDIKDYICSIILNIAQFGDENGIQELINIKTHVVLLQIIRVGNKANKNYVQYDVEVMSIVSKAMSILMYCARFSFIHPILIQFNITDVILPLLRQHSNQLEYIKAGIIVSLLYGHHEMKNELLSIGGSQPQTNKSIQDPQYLIHNDSHKVMKDIIHTLDSVVNRQQVVGGGISLSIIIRACMKIIMSDSNKDILMKSEIISSTSTIIPSATSLEAPSLSRSYLSLLVISLRQVLAMYLNDDLPILNTGGGRLDMESMELALETLVRISLIYDDDHVLHEKLMTNDVGLSATLDKIITSIDVISSLPKKAKRYIRILKSRFVSVSTSLPPILQKRKSFIQRASITDSKVPTKPHIMLSSSENMCTNPNLVRSLLDELKKSGFDVWTAEEGSQLYPLTTEEELDVHMVQAVDSSSVMIFCIDKHFKDNISSHLQAIQGQKSLKTNNIRFVFIMLDSTYTPMSQPDCCDGWLGNFIGDSSWYPLWEGGSGQSSDNNLKKIIQTLIDMTTVTRSQSSLRSLFNNLSAISTSLGSKNTTSSLSSSSHKDYKETTILSVPSYNSQSRSQSPAAINGRADLLPPRLLNTFMEDEGKEERKGDNSKRNHFMPRSRSSSITPLATPVDKALAKEDSVRSAQTTSTATTSSPLTVPNLVNGKNSSKPICKWDNKDKIDFSLAMEFLQNPQKVMDSNAVVIKMEELGVESASDIGGLYEEDLRELSSLLKKAQRVKFLDIFQLE